MEGFGVMKSVLKFSALFALAALSGCGSPDNSGDRIVQELLDIDPAALIGPLLADAGEVTTNSPAKGRVPVYVLPESHNSLQQQREQALILVRMQRKLGISTIVLEGATDISEQPKRMDVDAAYGLFTEGDINSAEFMAVSFGVPLTAGETAEGYAVEAPRGSLCRVVGQMAWLDALLDAGEDKAKVEALKARRVSLGQGLDALMKKNVSFMRDLGKTGAIDCPGVADKGRRISTAENAILANLISPSSRFAPVFARNCPVAEQARDAPSQIEDELEDIATLAAFANEAPAGLVDDQQGFLEQQRAFLQSRADATRVMVERAVAAARDAAAPVVMIVGAGHEQGTVAALRTAGIPFAVLSTIDLKTEGDNASAVGDSLTPGEYARKIDVKPARNTAINRALEGPGAIPTPVCPKVLKKPPLSIYAPWARRKADVYDVSRRFAEAALSSGGSGSPPPPPPPAGWQNDSASIDPSRARFNHAPDGRLLGVAFPLTIKAAGNAPEKTVWLYVEKRDATTDKDIETRLHEDVTEGRRLGKLARVAFLSRTLKARTYDTSEELSRIERLTQQ